MIILNEEQLQSVVGGLFTVAVSGFSSTVTDALGVFVITLNNGVYQLETFGTVDLTTKEFASHTDITNYRNPTAANPKGHPQLATVFVAFLEGVKSNGLRFTQVT